ncbi:MAG: PTS fructose transporter subunit IIA [Alphaproteobacteria bacterium]
MVGMVLVTHGDIGKALLTTARKELGLKEHEMNARAVSIQKDDLLETSLTQIREALADIDQERGVVMLTDMFGATPANLATQMMPQGEGKADILYGMNLPMLLALAQTPDTMNLRDAVQAAEKAGRENIICSSSLNPQRHNLTASAPPASTRHP